MTPEDRANALCRRLEFRLATQPNIFRAGERLIAEAISEAVAEERERCRLLACNANDDYEADLAQKDRDREAAVAAEREACAKIVDPEKPDLFFGDGTFGLAKRQLITEWCERLAARIRARGVQVNRPPGSPAGD